jgi:hypothetical protein
MMSKPWRERLTYAAMSLFVGWHSFIMLVAPNSSQTAEAIRAVVQPYLSFFRLESTWAFFAPSVGKHSQFRYVIEDSSGKEHVFVPVLELNRLLPSDFWIRNSYYGLIESPGNFGQFFAAKFCRKHAALHPTSITLQAIQEQDFWPDDYLRGMNPLDPEFVKVDTLSWAPCEDQIGKEQGP